MCGVDRLKVVLYSLLLLAGQSAVAAEATNNSAKANTQPGTKVAFQKPAEAGPTSNLEYVFSAPPRESLEKALEIYEPIAKYLSQVTGKKIVFKYAGNWGVYQGQMQKGAYDLVFDGAHFNGWRVAKLSHNILAKVPGEHVFVVAVKKENEKIVRVAQLAGHTVCAHAPPNLGTLTLLNQFDNPARQPVIINTDGWDNIYRGMMEGKCAASVMPAKFLQKNDKDSVNTKVVYKANVLPDNAFSAGQRLSREDQAKIAQALISQEGSNATAKLREAYSGGKGFVAARNEEYVRLGELLKNEWGYN